MKCPWCNYNMTPGKLYGDRYSLKWFNQDQKLALGILAIGADIVGHASVLGGMFGRPYAVGHRCLECKKIVIDESKTE